MCEKRVHGVYHTTIRHFNVLVVMVVIDGCTWSRQHKVFFGAVKSALRELGFTPITAPVDEAIRRLDASVHV